MYAMFTLRISGTAVRHMWQNKKDAINLERGGKKKKNRIRKI